MTIKNLRNCALLLGAFAAGSLLTARFMTVQQARADSNRVYELRMYHTFPNRLTPLVTRFRNGEVKVFEQNHMKFMGGWVPQDAPNHENLFIYLLAHENRDAAKKNWADFGADPEWKNIQKTSEADGKIVEKVESTFMDPTDFSPLK
jgi:NIPSNAP protein